MSYVKTDADVQEAFPHGAVLVRDNKPVVELVYLEVKSKEDGTPVLVGYAYPSKDFYLDVNNVLPQKGGWLVFSGGKRAVLRPLSAERGESVKEMVDSA